MAYFERNGFVPSGRSEAPLTSCDSADNGKEPGFDTVKDVKYNNHLLASDSQNSTELPDVYSEEEVKVLKCFKCLIRNLIRLSDFSEIDVHSLNDLSTAFQALVH